MHWFYIWQVSQQTNATTKTRVTSWSLVAALALGEFVSLVAIRVQVELGCFHQYMIC